MARALRAGVAACAWPARACRQRVAGDRQATLHEELADVVQRQGAARPVPMPDALVQPENRVGEQAWVGLRDGALLHAAGEERGPGELDVAHARAGDPSCLLLARRLARHGDHALLGDQHAIAQDVVLAEIEQPVEQAHERRDRSHLRSAVSRVEPLPFGLQRLGMDLEQAVELGLEVVIQRRRAEADVVRRCRPTSCTHTHRGRNGRSLSSGSPGACCATQLGLPARWSRLSLDFLGHDASFD